MPIHVHSADLPDEQCAVVTRRGDRTVLLLSPDLDEKQRQSYIASMLTPPELAALLTSIGSRPIPYPVRPRLRCVG